MSPHNFNKRAIPKKIVKKSQKKFGDSKIGIIFASTKETIKATEL